MAYHILPRYYLVTISETGNLTFGTLPNGDGFFDNIQCRFYNPLPPTVADAIVKVKGFARWAKMVFRLGENLNPDFILNIVKTQTSPIEANPPTAIQFTVVYPNLQDLYTYDEVNPGQFLNGTAAIRRMISRACSDPQYDYNAFIVYQDDSQLEENLTIDVDQLYSVQGLFGGTISVPGTGYAVGDTITLAPVGGTQVIAAQVKVATLAVGGTGVGSFTVTNPGEFSAFPTSFTQASTSGAGTGFALTAPAFSVNENATLLALDACTNITVTAIANTF